MKALLTGANGFLGRAVLRRLLADGHHVIAFARRNLDVDVNDNLEVVLGDLCSRENLARLPWGELDAVIHLAASGVKASHREWWAALQSNVVGTQQLLNYVEHHANRKPRVFVAATFYERLLEQTPALRSNPYIATKAACSEITRIWSRGYSGAVVLGTFFQVYGLGDDPDNVLSYAARNFKLRTPAAFGSGQGLRDWIYVDDAASGVLAALNGSPTGLTECDIGSGRLMKVREMIECLAEIAGANRELLTFDAARDRPDIGATLAAKNLPPNWQPMISPMAGLASLYANS